MRKIFFLIIFLGTTLTGSYAEEAAKIVAKVNGQAITAKDLDDYYKMLTYKAPGNPILGQNETKGKEEALAKLIEDKLILEEAKKKNLEPYPHLVAGQLNKLIESYPSREDFENSLVERGLTMTVLKERISGQFLMRQVIDINVSSYISVSPQEVSKYYEEHKAEMKSPESYALWISESKDKNKIVVIAKTIKEKGIAEAEKEHSDSLVKLEAGMSELKDEIAQTVKNLKEGEQAVKTIDNVNYLVYLEKIIPPRILSLEEAQENVHNLIWNDKFRQRFAGWVKQLKDKAIIKTYL